MFLTLEEAKQHSLAAAKSDVAHHIWYGVSLNPYSTEMYRREWQEGFESTSEEPMRMYDMVFRRGRAAALLMKQLKETGSF